MFYEKFCHKKFKNYFHLTQYLQNNYYNPEMSDKAILKFNPYMIIYSLKIFFC